MKRLLSEKEWSRNVGTAGFPVSFLHEYAVGLIWDMLHTASGPLELPTMDGGRSCDVCAGIDQIIIPDALQSIGGYTPDISLLKNSRPVRCIEVVVTSPVPPQKLAAVQNLGVELVQVPVRNENDLRALAVIEPTAANHDRWWATFNPDEQTFRDVQAKYGVNWRGTRQYRILERQKKADAAVNAFMDDLSCCSPEVRRAFVAKLGNISDLVSLYPIRKDNPKYKVLHAEAGE